MSLDYSYAIDEEVEENPEILLALSKLSTRVAREISRRAETLAKLREEIRSRLEIRKSEDTGSSRFLSILAVDSTWSTPPLDLVAGSIAFIATGYVIAAPSGLGAHGISRVAARLGLGEVEGRFKLSIELDSKIMEYLTAHEMLNESVDMVMLDGSLYFSSMHDFYNPAPPTTDRRMLAGAELASLVSRALLDLMYKADELQAPLVGVVKRVSSKLLLPKISDIIGLKEPAYVNDKLLASIILEPGEYMILENYLEAHRKYLELAAASQGKNAWRLLKTIEYCTSLPENTPQGSLCNRMKKTAIAFYRHKGPTGYPQATRLDIYPANRAEEIIEYAMKHTTENNVPEPIDHVDRYVRIDTATIKRLYQILRSISPTPESLIALNLTNPQKRYLYEEKTG
ncbi:MAG: DNA double-strand break repair nuclease NurA [Thermoprotei archaeon]|nr:DNA double-strand break repair nuclease NurA [Thermoprotei archaeon]